jgi:hypothetical protein
MKQFCAFIMAIFATDVHGGSGMLAVGSAAPEFSLAPSSDDTVKLLDFRDMQKFKP